MNKYFTSGLLGSHRDAEFGEVARKFAGVRRRFAAFAVEGGGAGRLDQSSLGMPHADLDDSKSRR
jgi:hypothetical protein